MRKVVFVILVVFGVMVSVGVDGVVEQGVVVTTPARPPTRTATVGPTATVRPEGYPGPDPYPGSVNAVDVVVFEGRSLGVGPVLVGGLVLAVVVVWGWLAGKIYDWLWARFGDE